MDILTPSSKVHTCGCCNEPQVHTCRKPHIERLEESSEAPLARMMHRAAWHYEQLHVDACEWPNHCSGCCGTWHGLYCQPGKNVVVAEMTMTDWPQVLAYHVESVGMGMHQDHHCQS